MVEMTVRVNLYRKNMLNFAKRMPLFATCSQQSWIHLSVLFK